MLDHEIISRGTSKPLPCIVQPLIYCFKGDPRFDQADYKATLTYSTILSLSQSPVFASYSPPIVQW